MVLSLWFQINFDFIWINVREYTDITRMNGDWGSWRDIMMFSSEIYPHSQLVLVLECPEIGMH